MVNPNTHPERIVDKNGRETTVHKKNDVKKPNSRVTNVEPRITSPSGGMLGETGTLDDGTEYFSRGDFNPVKEVPNYINRWVGKVSDLHYTLGRESSVTFEVPKHLFADGAHVQGSALRSLPDYVRIERDAKGTTRGYRGYILGREKTLDLYEAVRVEPEYQNSKFTLLKGFFAGRYDGAILFRHGESLGIDVPFYTQPHEYVDTVSFTTADDAFSIYQPADRSSKGYHEEQHYLERLVSESPIGVNFFQA